MSYYTGIYLVGAQRFWFPFPKLDTFSEIFWVLPIDYMILEFFIYLFICNDKSKFQILLTLHAVKPKHVSFANEPFFRKMLVSIFSSNIPLYIEKNTTEELCKVLEMELKNVQHSQPKICV